MDVSINKALPYREAGFSSEILQRNHSKSLISKTIQEKKERLLHFEFPGLNRSLFRGSFFEGIPQNQRFAFQKRGCKFDIIIILSLF